jgi:hypothetical protein
MEIVDDWEGLNIECIIGEPNATYLWTHSATVIEFLGVSVEPGIGCD